MTKVSEVEYDDGNSGGNGNRTKEIRYLTDDVEANARVTEFKYDDVNRLATFDRGDLNANKDAMAARP